MSHDAADGSPEGLPRKGLSHERPPRPAVNDFPDDFPDDVDHLGDERDHERRQAGGGRTPQEVMERILALDAESAMADVAAAIDAAQVLAEWQRAVQTELTRRVVAWIDLHGPVVIGSAEYRASYPSTTRCLDVVSAGRAILDALGGDLDGLLGHLVAQPYRYGALRNVLPAEVYGRHFRTDRTGKLTKTLRRWDSRYLRGGTPGVRPASTGLADDARLGDRALRGPARATRDDGEDQSGAAPHDRTSDPAEDAR